MYWPGTPPAKDPAFYDAIFAPLGGDADDRTWLVERLSTRLTLRQTVALGVLVAVLVVPTFWSSRADAPVWPVFGLASTVGLLLTFDAVSRLDPVGVRVAGLERRSVADVLPRPAVGAQAVALAGAVVTTPLCLALGPDLRRGDDDATLVATWLACLVTATCAVVLQRRAVDAPLPVWRNSRRRRSVLQAYVVQLSAMRVVGMSLVAIGYPIALVVPSDTWPTVLKVVFSPLAVGAWWLMFGRPRPRWVVASLHRHETVPA